MRVKSATTAVGSDATVCPPPAINNLPGRYMTGEPSNTGLTFASAGEYARVLRSRIRDTPFCPDIVKNLPFGNTKLNGYLSVFTSEVSTFSMLHELARGS